MQINCIPVPDIPNLKPYVPVPIRRFDKPLSLVKTKDKLSDYCSTLRGDKCCSCWEAYFELQDLEKKWPKEAYEKFVDKSRYDMDSLISRTHRANKSPNSEASSSNLEEAQKHKPDGLPKTREEIEEEEESFAKMNLPDSEFCRFLRSLRIYPKWYAERPDVEYD